MARGGNEPDLATLQMALVGYELERRKIDAKIAELRAKLKGKRIPVVSGALKAPAAKRNLSDAARRRIAMAQKRRWAEHRKRAALAAKAQ
jgi:hypothetical protein